MNINGYRIERVYAKETRGKGYVRIRKRIISITGFGL